MDSATLIRDSAAIFLMAAGTVLCVTLTIGLFKIFPLFRRSAQNIGKVTESATEASPDIVAASQNLKRPQDTSAMQPRMLPGQPLS